MPSLLVLAITTSASAATVVSFVAVRTGDTLIVSNPQGSTVTGEIRLVPDTGTTAMPPRAFSLPSQGSQTFPNVLSTFGTITSPAILAVESSDAVTLSSSPLRVAYPERHLTLPIRFNPDTPATGSLILGILSGLIRVSIYEPPSVTPLVTRTFGSSGEQVTRLRYADLIPAGRRINDGFAVVTPLTGQAVATVVNAPARRRSVGRGSAAPPVLSITGGPACEFETGVHASSPPAAGATYQWTLLNATSQGALTSNALDIALGSTGYASLGLERTLNGSVSGAEASIRIEGKPVYTSSGAPSVTLGEDATIEWTLAGSTPTSQTLSGTDFATINLDASARSYTYRPATEGPKTYALNADNACGGSGASGGYEVSAACTTPHIDSFTNSGAVCAGGSAQLTWTTSGSGTVTISNGVGTVSASGSIAVSPSATTLYTITKTASCGADSGTTTVTVPKTPVITSYTAPATVAPGAGGTITFAYTDGTSYAFTSSLGNTFTPSGGNSTTGESVNYNRDNAAGPDTITLTVTGPCGTTQDTRVINDPPVITGFTTNPTSINFSETTTLTFTIANGSTWSLSSSIGNGFSQSSGTGSGPFTIMYSAANNEGTDTVTLTASGPGGASSATVTILVGAPRIVSFTATPTTIGFGATATLNFTIENGAWTLNSSIGNTFSQSSGTSSGTFTITYSANANTGTDTVTLLVTRPTNTPPPLPPASATVTIQVNN